MPTTADILSNSMSWRCTLRSLDIIYELERSLGKPALCLSQAMIWDTLRLAGVKDRKTGFRRLLRDR